MIKIYLALTYTWNSCLAWLTSEKYNQVNSRRGAISMFTYMFRAFVICSSCHCPKRVSSIIYGLCSAMKQPWTFPSLFGLYWSNHLDETDSKCHSTEGTKTFIVARSAPDSQTIANQKTRKTGWALLDTKSLHVSQWLQCVDPRK